MYVVWGQGCRGMGRDEMYMGGGGRCKGKGIDVTLSNQYAV
jgi:hypothetical protein